MSREKRPRESFLIGLLVVLITTERVTTQVIISPSTAVCGGTTTETMLGYSIPGKSQNTNGVRASLRCDMGCYITTMEIKYSGAIEVITVRCSNDRLYTPIGWSGSVSKTFGTFTSQTGFSGADVYFGGDVNALSIWYNGAKSGTILGCGGSPCQSRLKYDCGSSVITGIEVYQQAGSNNWIQAFQPICGYITCTDTAYSSNGVCIFYAQCKSGEYYIPFGTCVRCPVGQTSSGGYSRGCTACTSVTGGVKFNTAGDCATTQCAAGTYSDSTPSTACINCWSNSNSFPGASSCTCNTGYYGTGSLCTLCPAGSKCSGGTNKDTCGPGYYSQAGASVCSSCPAGAYTNNNGLTVCSDCASGTYSPTPGSALCSVCDFGTYSSKIRSTVCNLCNTGSYTTTKGATACLQCSPGSYSMSTLDTSCKACNAGTYASKLSSTECASCPTGSFSSAPSTALCTPCSPGFYSSVVATTMCAACSTGSVSSASGMNYCVACGPGTYSNDALSCGQCAPGSYSEYSKAPVCTKCPMGQYSTAIGMTDGSLCVRCEPGTYGDLMGMTACLKCPAGTATGRPGTTDIRGCDECMDGYLAESPGMTKCRLCTPPTCTVGQRLIPCTTTTDTKCETCPAIENCEYVLPNGCLKAGTNTPTCYCKAGYELVNGKCQLCADGMFKVDSSDSRCTFWTVTSCPLPTQYLANGTAYFDAQCLPCPKLPPNTVASPLEQCGWKCNAGFEK